MKKGTKSKKETKPVKEKKDEKKTDDYYTKEEIKLLDYFHKETENKFEDEEIYELMEKYSNDKALILEELGNLLKERKRGDDFDWQEVGKGN